MLHLFTRIGQIGYYPFMSVYKQTLEEAAYRLYSHLDMHVAMVYAEQDLYTYLDTVFFRTPGATIAVWAVNDQYKSALRIEPFLDGFLITSLETAPDSRNQGYAYALLSAVTKHFMPIYSHVRYDNPASMRCHSKAGFHKYRDSAVFLDGSLHPECATLRYDVPSLRFNGTNVDI